MADGATIRCRAKDSGDWISVYVELDYELPLDWSDLQSIVDVGACVGSFTVWAAKRSPHARLIAVEPNPEVMPYLVENIQTNQLASRVAVVEAAVGGVTGLAAIENANARTTEMHVVPVESGGGPAVRMFSLEGLLQEAGLDSCDLLKLDCEGGEYDALLSAPDSVLKRIRAIVCEFHPVEPHRPSDLAECLTRSGFQVTIDDAAIGIIRAVRPSDALRRPRPPFSRRA
jgi:FkbM family methyltransferase